jgi:hypothetical protein
MRLLIVGYHTRNFIFVKFVKSEARCIFVSPSNLRTLDASRDPDRKHPAVLRRAPHPSRRATSFAHSFVPSLGVDKLGCTHYRAVASIKYGEPKSVQPIYFEPCLISQSVVQLGTVIART